MKALGVTGQAGGLVNFSNRSETRAVRITHARDTIFSRFRDD